MDFPCPDSSNICCRSKVKVLKSKKKNNKKLGENAKCSLAPHEFEQDPRRNPYFFKSYRFCIKTSLDRRQGMISGLKEKKSKIITQLLFVWA